MIRWHFSVVAALSLALAACGGSAAPASPGPASKAPAASSSAPAPAAASSAPASAAKPSASAPASAAAAAKPATGSPYVIGVDTSITGPYAILGVPLKAGLDFEIKRVNDAGGLDGHPIKMFFTDDRSDPTQGVANLKTIIEQHPVALIGPSFSSVSMALSPLVTQAKLPDIVVSVPLAPDDPEGKKMPKYVFESPQAPIPEATAIL
ncbi:MAG: ABC transporter substrate-binding protein, partial [Chloroflexota bacterium]|nr:ABC transporter substrate-binding protein [Chloroflexota bacterium]